jgi:hypothetical protein
MTTREHAAKRARRLAKSLASLAFILETPDAPKEYVDRALAQVDAMHKAYAVREINSEVGAALYLAVTKGAAALFSDGASDKMLRHLARGAIARFANKWPTRAKEITIEQMANAIRLWPTTRGGARGRGSKWKAIAELERAAGMTKTTNEAVRRRWENYAKPKPSNG